MGNVFSNTDIRGRADDSLTTDYAWTAGKAFSEWLPEEGDAVIVRGQSANETTVHAVIEGLLLQGRNVFDAGQGDVRTMVAAISDKQAVGGVLVTHEDLQNLEVITLFDAQGVAITSETGLDDISGLIDAANFLPAAEKGQLLQ